MRGDITFEDVSFQYEENTEQVLQHINLTVPAALTWRLSERPEREKAHSAP